MGSKLLMSTLCVFWQNFCAILNNDYLLSRGLKLYESIMLHSFKFHQLTHVQYYECWKLSESWYMEGLDTMHKRNRHVCVQWSVFQWVHENQSLLDSQPDLHVHILVKMGTKRSEIVWQEGSKRSRSYKNNGPKRPESCKMGGGGGQKLNNTKMAVTKIQLE